MLRIGGYRLCWICCMQYFRISKLVNDGCMVKLSRGAPFHNAYFFGQRIYPKVTRFPLHQVSKLVVGRAFRLGVCRLLHYSACALRARQDM